MIPNRTLKQNVRFKMEFTTGKNAVSDVIEYVASEPLSAIALVFKEKRSDSGMGTVFVGAQWEWEHRISSFAEICGTVAYSFKVSVDKLTQKTEPNTTNGDVCEQPICDLFKQVVRGADHNYEIQKNTTSKQTSFNKSGKNFQIIMAQKIGDMSILQIICFVGYW